MRIIKFNSFIVLSEEDLLRRKIGTISIQNPFPFKERIVGFFGFLDIVQTRVINQCFLEESKKDLLLEPVKLVTKKIEKQNVLDLTTLTKKEKGVITKEIVTKLNISNYDHFINDVDIAELIYKLSSNNGLKNIKAVIFPFNYIKTVSNIKATMILDKSCIDLKASNFYNIDTTSSKKTLIV